MYIEENGPELWWGAEWPGGRGWRPWCPWSRTPAPRGTVSNKRHILSINRSIVMLVFPRLSLTWLCQIYSLNYFFLGFNYKIKKHNKCKYIYFIFALPIWKFVVWKNKGELYQPTVQRKISIHTYMRSWFERYVRGVEETEALRI